MRSNFINDVKHNKSCEIMLPKNIVDNNRYAQKSLDKAVVVGAAEKIHVE